MNIRVEIRGPWKGNSKSRVVREGLSKEMFMDSNHTGRVRRAGAVPLPLQGAVATTEDQACSPLQNRVHRHCPSLRTKVFP